MAKFIVAIESGDGRTAKELLEYIEQYKNDFFPIGPGKISLDKMDIQEDPTDDSFFIFEYRGVEN